MVWSDDDSESGDVFAKPSRKTIDWDPNTCKIWSKQHGSQGSMSRFYYDDLRARIALKTLSQAGIQPGCDTYLHSSDESNLSALVEYIAYVALNEDFDANLAKALLQDQESQMPNKPKVDPSGGGGAARAKGQRRGRGGDSGDDDDDTTMTAKKRRKKTAPLPTKACRMVLLVRGRGAAAAPVRDAKYNTSIQGPADLGATAGLLARLPGVFLPEKSSDLNAAAWLVRRATSSAFRRRAS